MYWKQLGQQEDGQDGSAIFQTDEPEMVHMRYLSGTYS